MTSRRYRCTAADQAHQFASLGLYRRLVLALGVICPVVAFFAAPAQAGTLHFFKTTFAGSGTDALSNPTDVVVDNSSGTSAEDVYVTDPANHRVEKFSPTGEFILMFGKAVNKTEVEEPLSTEAQQNVCTAASGNTCQPGTSASSPGAFQTPTFVAVDSSSGPSSGDVYVGDTADGKVSKFDSSGNPVASWGTGGQLPTNFNPLDGITVDPSGNLFVLTEEGSKETRWYEQDGTLHSTFGAPRGTSPAGLAVDHEDNLYKVDGSPEVTKFSDTGENLGEPDTNDHTTGLAIDPSTNDLYAVEEGTFVDRFAFGCGQGCFPLESFGSGHLSGAQGLALDANTGTVYVANTTGGNVVVFFQPILPKVTTEPATNPGLTSAILHGHLNPNGGGEITECYFEWGVHATYHHKTPCAEGNSFSTESSVHAEIAGLLPGTIYHYRLVAANEKGSADGEDQTFTTLGSTPERALVAKITGLRALSAIATDSADHVWIAHDVEPATGRLGIDEYAAYPSLAKIGEQTGEGQFREENEYLAADSSTGALYVGEYVLGLVYEFDAAGNLVPPQWSFGSFSVGGLAVDNSGGESNGVIYVVQRGGPFTSPSLKAFQSGEIPSDFSAHEPYIKGNTISLGEVRAEGGISMAVDATGNIFLTGGNSVSEFNSRGEFVQSITGAEVPGGFGAQGSLRGITIDPTDGDILLLDDSRNEFSGVVKYFVDEFSPSGEYLQQLTGPSPSESFSELNGAIAVNSSGYLYVGDRGSNAVDIFKPRQPVPGIKYSSISNTTPTSGTLNANIQPTVGEEVTSCHFEYGTTTFSTSSFSLGEIPCLSNSNVEIGTKANPIISETEVHASISGLATDTTYYYRGVAGNSTASRPGLIQSFTPRAVQALETKAATNVTATTAELNGSYRGNGEKTRYYFQYGSDTTYGEATETLETGPVSGPQTLGPITITGLQPNATYHFRLVASNSVGTTYGQDQTLTTLTKPSIDGLSSSAVTATTAVLHARINPQGGDTKYRFEYGVTTAYGQTITGPEKEITSDLFADHSVEVDLGNLQEGVIYHFRVVAENPYGTSDSEDQTFGFHPPDCPNSHIRQITNSSNLPDCRAYELVSPANANGTLLFPEGPNSAEAVSPARFAFGGAFGVIPGAGSPPNTKGDLYVATRTDEGWTTEYVGFPGNEAYTSGGPPAEARSNRDFPFLVSVGGVRTDPTMNRFLDWKNFREITLVEGNFHPPFNASVWSADGGLLQEWPSVSGYKGSPIFAQSADFSHYVFQTGAAPSLSLIDDNTSTDTATEVSKTEAGAIPIQPGDTTPDEESLRIAAVSNNGSHILMAARAEPLNRVPEEPGFFSEYLCGFEIENSTVRQPLSLCPLQPSQLYMRVNDAATYEIAPGDAVKYVGETPTGSKVYFTSEAHLTNEDEEHGGASLYMWSAEKAEHAERPLTLISKGDNAGLKGQPGNTSACRAVWTQECGILPFVNDSFNEVFVQGYVGGNGLSDNSIAAENGDIYFFSPEQLAGPRGVNGQENLYDYRGGSLHYVATFAPQAYCNRVLEYCSAGPVIRMQVSPDDKHMAFLTADRVTSYDNHGHTEMYTYNQSSEEVKCVSCLPGGDPPTSDVYASSNGLFMTNDGRTFFSTVDPLVPEDTDHVRDVYEYVEGHAQLISSGISATATAAGVPFGTSPELFTAGLVGVSADGVNAYFSTYDDLVGQDHNGNELRFYDARTDGGFPYLAPTAPCEAADECHGEGSSPASSFQNGSGAMLGTAGNYSSSSRAAHHTHRLKRHKRRHRGKRHNQSHARRGHG